MYNKLFTKILDSSIWLEPMPTRIVWLTMIATMDETGFCQFAAVANVAHRARVSLDQAQKAIACLEGPDSESSDPDNNGRRVERVPGGWMVLNAEKHRSMVTRVIIQTQTRDRVRRFREKAKRISNATVTPSEALSETKANSKIKIPRAARVALPSSDFNAFWQAYPRKVGKAGARQAWDKHAPILARVLTALEWQTQQPGWTKDGGQFIPHPTTWLNRAGWDDEPFYVPVSTPAQPIIDWFDECKALHQGTCNGKHAHHLKTGAQKFAEATK